jgi:pyruvate/2-oxoglutarate dehydrogenase complex dihydrolipoamide acyltransferase (E2) component
MQVRWLPAVLFGLALAGCDKGPGAAAPKGAAATSTPLLVSPEDLHTVRNAALSSGPSITGSIQPERRADLRAEVQSVVMQVLRENGDQVRKGDVLVRLDDTAIRDGLASAGGREPHPAQSQLYVSYSTTRPPPRQLASRTIDHPAQPGRAPRRGTCSSPQLARIPLTPGRRYPHPNRPPRTPDPFPPPPSPAHVPSPPICPLSVPRRSLQPPSPPPSNRPPAHPSVVPVAPTPTRCPSRSIPPPTTPLSSRPGAPSRSPPAGPLARPLTPNVRHPHATPPDHSTI